MALEPTTEKYTLTMAVSEVASIAYKILEKINGYSQEPKNVEAKTPSVNIIDVNIEILKRVQSVLLEINEKLVL